MIFEKKLIERERNSESYLKVILKNIYLPPLYDFVFYI